MRAVEQYVHHYVLCDTIKTGGFIGCHIAGTPTFCFVLHTLFVVTLAVGYVAVLVGIRKAIAVLEPTHSRLHVRVSRIVPAQHTLLYQSWTLCTHIRSPVLKNEIRFTVRVAVSLLSSRQHTVLIVMRDIIHQFLVIVRCLSTAATETVTKIHTVTVHLVLLNPIFECAGEHIACRCEVMIPFLIDIVVMRYLGTEPRVETQF